MENIFEKSSKRPRIEYYQISHYLVNSSDFEILILKKIGCLIGISKCPLLLKHPVYVK